MVTVAVWAEDDGIAGEIQRGVRRYIARERLDWTVRMVALTGEGAPFYGRQVLLLGWRIGEALHASILGRGWSVAELSQTVAVERPGLTYVWPDDAGIGATAAAHLVRSGFRHVLHPAAARGNPIRERRTRALAECLRTAGVGCDPIALPTSPTDGEGIGRLRSLLDRLSRPVALFCYQDRVALWHLNMLQEVGFEVPDELGILGVDDTPMAGQSEPGLSSVRVDRAMIADRALQTLHGQLAGTEPPPGTVLVPICAVKERRSTQVRQLAHPIMRRAQRLIERSLPKGLSVAALARRLDLTPAQLAWYCQRALDLPPGRWIRQRRLDAVCDLLASDEASIGAIARRCGFVDASHLARHFKRVYGRTPVQYRIGH